jgi:murein DD-endopeptidase MepM/ murein hydrolase activator NlpD
LYQFHDIGSGAGGGTSVLRFDSSFLRPPVASAPIRARATTLRARLSKLELVTDLGQNIGSLEWFRGFALCAALCYSAYSFAPGIQPFVGVSPPPLADAQWEEARSLSIAPLAYGADMGKRMAATDQVEALADTPERPSIERLASLGPSDGFVRALKRAGVSSAEAERVAGIVGQAMPISEIVPGTTANLTLGRRANKNAHRPLDSMAFRARFELKLEVKRMGGQLVLNRIPIPIDSTPLRVQGRVGASLYRAARAAGAPARAVESYLRAVATQVDVGHIGANDRFDIIVEHRRAATGETETGQLLYAGLDRSAAKDLRLVQWDVGGRTQWFEASGVGRSSGMLQRPVPGTVSSNFGMRRHPILGYSRMHKGIDYRAGYGTPILAVADGRIVRAGWTGGYGKQVRINHAGGLGSSYAHMSRIAAQPGQFVRQGQVIGYVGSTGLSTGPHLHFEMTRNGVVVNPASVKYISNARLAGKDLANFRNRLRHLLSVPIGGEAAAEAQIARAQSRPTRG